MTNVRVVYSNSFDDATAFCPDALPSMPIENAQSAGRAQRTRMAPIQSVVNMNPSWQSTIDAPVDAPGALTAASIACWVYRTGDLDSSGLIRLRSNGSISHTYLSINYSSNSQAVGQWTNDANTYVTTAVTLTLNTWHHVAVTWESGGLVSLYLDGALQYTVDPANDDSLTGVDAATPTMDVVTECNNTKIALLRIDGRCWDASEVAALADYQYVHDGALIERWAFQNSLVGERGTTLTGSSTYNAGPDAHATTNMTQIRGTWASSQVLSAMALVRHNLGTGATVNLELYSDAAYGTAVYTAGTAAPFTGTRTGDYLSYALYFTPTTAQSFAIEVQNNGTAWDMSRVVLGSHFEPSRNASYGLSLSWSDTGQRSRTEGGAVIAEPGEIYRSMSMAFNRVGTADRPTWSALAYAAGNTNEVFVSVFPNDSNSQQEMDYSMTGVIDGLSASHDFPGNWVVPFTIEET